MLPNDWIFEKCRDLLLAASAYSSEELEDARHEIVESCVDIYTVDLYEWGKRFGHYVEDAEMDLGPSTGSITDKLSMGQYYQLDRMLGILLEGIKK